MGYGRKIRLEYYEVVCKNKEDEVNVPDRRFDLNLWIDRAARLSLEARTYDYFEEQARLDKFWYDKETDFWFLNFIRLRETNIPNKASIDKEAEPLVLEEDEFIGEDANALYDERIGVLTLQRNRYSLGVQGIEEYLNLIWNSDEQTIYLRPICPINLQQKTMRAKNYRKFTIRFADIQNRNLDSDARRPFKKIFDSMREYEAVNAEITITMGYNKNDSLDINTVHETINDINRNRGVVVKAEVGIKENEDTNVEVIDLFSDKMHDFIFVYLEKRESLASEYVAAQMTNRYIESRGTIMEALRERG